MLEGTFRMKPVTLDSSMLPTSLEREKDNVYVSQPYAKRKNRGPCATRFGLWSVCGAVAVAATLGLSLFG